LLNQKGPKNQDSIKF